MDLVPFRGDGGAPAFARDTFDDMDLETAALILQLQIEDSEELFASSGGKGKGKEGVLSETQLALQIFKEEMQRRATMIADRQMTRSINEACRTDSNEITMSLAQEQAAARDRQISLVVSSVTEPLAITEGVVNEDELDDVLERLDALYMIATRDDPATNEESMALVPYGVKGDPESSTRAATQALTAPKRQCTACQESLLSFELARVPCSHEYCGSCLRDLFSAAMTDDTLFPPRCCREPITPIGHVRIYLSTNIVQRYEAKKIEFDTPNRTYCSNPLCSSFIRAEHIAGDQASCQLCRAVTCTICKVAAHRGDCPEDTALQQVLEVAKDNEWQRCWSCHRVVELDTGCNHITFVPPPQPL
ncbi:IBR finger domain protein [Diplocarpon rosae]|nr:IBR finger domain protein [Diplocarpon rosae]